MQCPNCQYQWKSFTSWRLSPWNPAVCPECKTTSVRDGKVQPLMITVAGIVIFKMAISYVQLTTIGVLLVLFLLLVGAMWLDEKTIQLKPVDGNMAGGMPPANSSGDDKNPVD